MAQLKQVFDQRTGQFVWVDEQGRIVKRVNPGLGSLPGQAEARERDLLSRLPDAQLAGASGPTVSNPQSMRGARPNDPDPVPPHTYRPLAGAKQNYRGISRIVKIPAGNGTVVVGSVVESSRQAGDDAESLIVTCQATVPPPIADLVNIDGFLEFGIGGAIFNADFDWPVGGVSFAIPGSFVRIGCDVNHRTITENDITLSAALAYGPGPQLNGSSLRKTFFLGTVPAGGSVQGIVPPFASTVTIVAEVAAPNISMVLSGQDNPITGGPITSASATFIMNGVSNAANQQDQFPIPGWGRRFTVTNNGAANSFVSLIFGLAL